MLFFLIKFSFFNIISNMGKFTEIQWTCDGDVFEVEELKTLLGQLGTVLCLGFVQVITRALFDEAFSIT